MLKEKKNKLEFLLLEPDCCILNQKLGLLSIVSHCWRTEFLYVRVVQVIPYVVCLGSLMCVYCYDRGV